MRRAFQAKWYVVVEQIGFEPTTSPVMAGALYRIELTVPCAPVFVILCEGSTPTTLPGILTSFGCDPNSF